MSYHTNIVDMANANDLFRQVVHTGAKSQLVLMCLPPGGEIGAEVHQHVEQTIVIVSGSGQSVIDGVTEALSAGDCLVVTPGANHNIVNTGQVPMKLYTVYAPANHLDGRVHKTKAEADADTEDEAFGETVQ